MNELESRLKETLEAIVYPEYPSAHIGVTHPVYPGVHEAGKKSLGEAIGGSNWIPFAIGAGLVWVTMTTSGRRTLSSLTGSMV